MAPKRATSTKDVSDPKRKRKMMTNPKKVKVLDMAKEGEFFAAITRHYGVNASTIRYVKKDEVTLGRLLLQRLIQRQRGLLHVVIKLSSAWKLLWLYG